MACSGAGAARAIGAVAPVVSGTEQAAVETLGEGVISVRPRRGSRRIAGPDLGTIDVASPESELPMVHIEHDVQLQRGARTA
jgi:hypothetical protein